MSASEQGQSTDLSAGVGTGTVNQETGAGAAVEQEQPSGIAQPSLHVGRLEQIRVRVLPILEAIKTEYTGRTRKGYPAIIDNVQRGGVFGLTLDPGWAIYFMTDGERVFAELHETSLRTDTLSMANVEKFAARPSIDQREVDETWTDRDFRNLVSELLHGWNYQQLRIYRVDS